MRSVAAPVVILVVPDGSRLCARSEGALGEGRLMYLMDLNLYGGSGRIMVNCCE